MPYCTAPDRCPQPRSGGDVSEQCLQGEVGSGTVVTEETAAIKGLELLGTEPITVKVIAGFDWCAGPAREDQIPVLKLELAE